VLSDGTVLSDIVAVLTFIGSMDPRAMAPQGSSAYYASLGLLSFINTEVHALFGHLFNPSLPEETKEIMRTKLQGKLHYLNLEIMVDGRHFLVGDKFSVVDAYMFVVLSWAAHAEVDIDTYKYMKRYVDRLAAMPFVEEAFDLMGHNPAGTMHV
jgi:glutathione S-transferase